MEIRAFAERLLFGASLADKLLAPGAATDARPGPAVAVPEAPGRPPGLAFSDRRAPFPSAATLDRAEARGQVLHAFANHELLALELMALVLLRFPDAPPAFRRGLVRTITEEQAHLGAYLDRMRETGTTFGELPVNAFFWRCIADVPTPRDFVARTSLVFEQANLDHALYWSAAFRAAGDAETSAVLDRVREDEIGHVRFGLAWFERWRDPDQPLWDAFTAHLALPLSASRAKGPLLDREGRARAGLPEAFVDALAVQARSKGRPPVVHRFNPDCEAEVLRGRPGHTPSREVAALARDLGALPMFLCRPDDVVWVERVPSAGFLRGLADAGFPIPELTSRPDHPRYAGAAPWGESPESAKKLAPYGARPWDPARTALWSKAWSARLAAALTPEIAGAACETLEQALAAIGQREVVAKLPFSTSGRARRRFGPGPVDDAGRAWLAAGLRRQGAVIVEPWLDRVADLSVQLTVADEVRIDGTVRFLTDPGGRFRGCVLGRAETGLPTELRRHVASERPRLEGTARDVGVALQSAGHRGPAGLDALVWRDGETLRTKPIVEVNPRATMGRVALGLSARLLPGRVGLWLLLGPRDLARAGFTDWAAASALARPVRREHGRVAEGLLFTTEPHAGAAFATVAAFGSDLDTCAAAFPAAWRPRAL